MFLGSDVRILMKRVERWPFITIQERQRQNSRATGFPNRRAHLFWLVRTLICGTLLALGLVLLVQQVIRVSLEPSDFCQDYIAAQRVAQGIAVYLPLHSSSLFRYCPPSLGYDAHPPSSVLLILPFSIFPYMPAVLIWGLCSLAAYLAAGILLLQELGWRSLPGIALFVIGSAYWQPLVGAEGAQNFWQVLTLLLVVAWLLERKGHAKWAGGLLGLAGLLKIWPATLLLGAVARQRWWFVLAGGFVLILGTALALGVLGPAAYAAYLGPVQASENHSVPANGNISLVGVVARLFVGNLPLLPPLARGLGRDGSILLGEGIAGLLLLSALALIRWCYQRRQDEVAALLCQGLLVAVALLVFPLTWYFGLITFLLPCTTTILALRRLSRPPRWWFGLLGMSLLPLLAPYSVFTLAGWLLEQQITGGAWLGTLLLALPTAGLLLFAAIQGYLLWHISARRDMGVETQARSG
jgi:hypothetical protein